MGHLIIPKNLLKNLKKFLKNSKVKFPKKIKMQNLLYCWWFVRKKGDIKYLTPNRVSSNLEVIIFMSKYFFEI